jgi:AcrR family transcriptional regulator
MSATAKWPRQRVPASERRDALVDAAIHEFAHGGLHGAPVDRIARRVGVAQPYVFRLFGSKKELFLAAVERGFQRTADAFARGAAGFDPAIARPDADVLNAMGDAYAQLVRSDRDYLMLQHQAYAACDDPEICERVRALYARLVRDVEGLAAEHSRRAGLAVPGTERIDEFFRYGMWMNVAAAMGVYDLSAGCEWIREDVAAGSDPSEDVASSSAGGSPD